MQEEGYIKFQSRWTQKAPLPYTVIQELLFWRQKMYQHHLLGAYPDGIGFGNISQRYTENQFLISGSATGNFPKLGPQHFSLVSDFDIAKNLVICEGPIIASSESMSHAVIYQECPEVNAVIHIHHMGLWKKWKHRLPTTDESATYGTPEMARAIIQLLKETSVRKKEKTFVMAGHQEGLIAFGNTLEEAGVLNLKLIDIL